jgi:hypothetical protein
VSEATPGATETPPDVDAALAVATVRDAAARAQVRSAIRELGREGEGYTQERLERLMRLEDHFQALLLYGQLEFLREPGMPSDPEREFALDVQRIHLEAANGFQRFLRNRASWARSREALETMYRLTGLAVNAIHGAAKWGYFLGETGRNAAWKQLHALFALAEADGYARAPFLLHPSSPHFAPTVESLYIRALLLDALNTGSLSRPQVEIADGWLAAWCAGYAIEKEGRPESHTFLVDLASSEGLVLAARERTAANPRYLRADAMRSDIEALQASLRKGRLEAPVGAGAVFPIEEHAALVAAVEKLERSIALGGESRTRERVAFEDREVDVCSGMERVLRKVREAAERGTPEEGALQFPAVPDPEVERWRVRDVSTSGYGLLVDRTASEAALLNGIVGLRNHETGGWIVGTIVRKLPGAVRGEVLLGVEVVGYRPIAVELEPEGPSNVPALFLPGDAADGRADSLLLPPGDFRLGSRFALRVGGARYHVRLNRIAAKGADWINARYEIESKA